MEQKKVAIFDVDKTIIHNDSMFQFVRYTISRYPLQLFRLPLVIIHTLLYKLGFMRVERVKQSYFHVIGRMSEKDLEYFYEHYLHPAIYPEAQAEMAERKNEGYYVLLVTASPHAYMKFFRNLPWVDEVIGTQLVREGERYTSRIEGRNCKGEEKVRRIQAHLDKKGLKLDASQSCAYSDSVSDMPMMKLVRQRVFINRSVPGMEERVWGK